KSWVHVRGEPMAQIGALRAWLVTGQAQLIGEVAPDRRMRRVEIRGGAKRERGRQWRVVDREDHAQLPLRAEMTGVRRGKRCDDRARGFDVSVQTQRFAEQQSCIL